MLSPFKNVHDLLVALTGKLREFACSNGATIAKLRRLALEGGDEIRGAMNKCASESGSGLPRVARNVAATVPAGGTAAFVGLLRHWVVTDPFEPLHEHQALVESVCADHTAIEMIGWLLAGGETPNQASVAAFFGKDLRVLLMFEREAGPSPITRTAGYTARFLKSIIGSRPGKPEKQTHAILAKEGFAKGLVPFDEQAFKKLPAGMRRWILADMSFVKAALADPLRRRILANPEGHPDTPEALALTSWLKHYPAAIEDLRNARFGAASVDWMFRQHRFTKESSDEILEALHQGFRLSATSGQPAWISSRLAPCSSGNARLQLVLEFFSLHPGLRLSVADGLSPGAIRRLSLDVSVPEWISAVLRSNDEDLLKSLRPALLRQRSQRDQLLFRLGEARTSDECHSVFGKDALIHGDREVAMSLLAAHPSILGQIHPDDLGSRPIHRLVAGHLKDEARFMSFVSHGGKPLVETVMTTGIPAIRNARAKLLRMARISESPGFRMTFLRLVLVHSPSLLGERPAMRISDDEFDSLLRAVHSPAGIAALFRLKGRRGGSSWESCFRQGRCIIPISRAIRKQLPELRQRLEELEAARFLRRPGFKSTLRRVLAGKASAGSLGVPQRMLRHLIPWARKTWKDKPTLAVAHELALAFSVADARYLAFLCTERWKSPDRNRGGHVFDHHYRVHPLPKKSGGNRLVTVPSDSLKRLQRRILRSGLDEVFLHPAAHGFRSQRSILTNALPHVGHPCVVNVDIKSFFPSTRYPLILHACSLLAGGVLSEPACHVLADICSHAGGLPTGAPTSPALANLILRSADTSIAKAAKANNITYTRYADDLTFSGESNVLKILPFVSRVLGQLGYLLDDKKTNIFRRGRRQMVTGLVVNEKANLPRRIRRRLRAAVHQASNGGKPKWHGKPISKAKLLGRLGHLALVQPKEAAAFRQQLKGSGKTENTTQ